MAGPSLAGYLTFIRNIMGISTTVLPDDDPSIAGTYNQSLNWVNPDLALIPSLADPSFPSLYAEAVYDLAGDRLINYAQDQVGAAIIQGSDPPMPFFQYSRKQYNINAFVSGVITGAGDQATSTNLQVPQWADKLTLADLQTIKTPWGRAYMAIAQQYGPTVWGLTP